MNKTTTIILIVLAVIVVIAGAYALFTNKTLAPTETETAGNVYRNDQHGFSFAYPDGYVLTEREVGTADAGHLQIMLVAEADTELPEAGEGPTAVTIDVYQNDLETRSVLDWIENAPESNFGLGSGEYVGADVAGRDGFSYTWSGLYEGRTTAFQNEGDLIAISVTWMTPEDAIISVYDQVIESFRFTADGEVMGEQKG